MPPKTKQAAAQPKKKTDRPMHHPDDEIVDERLSISQASIDSYNSQRGKAFPKPKAKPKPKPAALHPLNPAHPNFFENRELDYEYKLFSDAYDGLVRLCAEHAINRIGHNPNAGHNPNISGQCPSVSLPIHPSNYREITTRPQPEHILCNVVAVRIGKEKQKKTTILSWSFREIVFRV